MLIEREYHHFKGPHLPRGDEVERFVVDEIAQSKLTDRERESSAAWEVMHMSSCKALCHMLAEKRGLNVEVARIAGCLHDIHVIRTGMYRDHARLGAEAARGILATVGGFGEDEVELVCKMIAGHSDKHVYSEDPYVELMKDVDVFDCSMYPGTEFYYLSRKPLPVCREYFRRVLRVREELGLPVPGAYRSLEVQEAGVLQEVGGVAGHFEKGVPTLGMLALWALSDSEECRDQPLAVVLGREGKLHWFLPRLFAVGSGRERVPGWDLIRSLRSESLDELRAVPALVESLDIRGCLSVLRTALGKYFLGIAGSAKVQEEGVVALREPAYAPADDGGGISRLASVCRKEVGAELGAWMSDSGLAAWGRPAWGGDLCEEEAVDKLARLHALAVLRGDSLETAGKILEDLGRRVGRDLLLGVPSDVFGCEASPCVSSVDDCWLAAAWPRFGRFEFLVGREARERFEQLRDYFGARSGDGR